ncbi:hypothetical protein [Leeia aquatica]|uniref:Uncharacterized protein n=1 Tax=Leeia aquatica TaxID=2725557 RepID=A0A847SG79_9NEIS|nr:hypothetical protein [Leeia aquatica]NLR76229.1 hypothetical protein [Leeia aquatica]
MRSSLALIGSLSVASINMAWGGTSCVDVPVQLVENDRTGPITALTAVQLPDDSKALHELMTTVTSHITTRMGWGQRCQEGAEHRSRSLLQFVNWKLTYIERALLNQPKPLEDLGLAGCRVSSPWLDMVYVRQPAPSVRAIIRWNARQLLADQAALAGVEHVQTGVVLPLPQAKLLDLAERYAELKFHSRASDAAFEAKVPADLKWMFSKTRYMNDLSPFSFQVGVPRHFVSEEAVQRYAQLITKLVDRCFGSNGMEIHYNSILETGDLISLEHYRINGWPE